MPTLDGWFLQTSDPHIPKMVLCFSIFERGSATASIQLLHESGAQWKRALQDLIFEASWMLWRRITRYRASNSNTTSMGIYRNLKIWALFNGTACFTTPRPPGRGVDMFRNTWCASVRTELSNAPAAWTCDLWEPPSDTETNVPDSSANQSCILLTGSEPARGGSLQRGQGVIFFCHCPRVVPFKNCRVVSGRLEVPGVCLRMEL